MQTLHTRTDHLEVARYYARNSKDWPIRPVFDPAKRWYECIADESDAQVWLLTWLPGQGTDLHDHGDSAGAFVVVSGALTEMSVTLSRSGARASEDTVLAGHGRRFGTNYVHQMVNTTRSPAISVHVYGPALETMNRYELTGAQLRKVATDRAGVTW